MKPGRVVSIRVNPADCISVVDVLREVDALVPGMSFSQAVSVALSSALETLRQGGVLPRRAGFEYDEVMQQFPAALRRNGRAMKITESMQLAQGEHPGRAMSAGDAAARKRRLRWQELAFKVQAGEIGNMSDEELVEYSNLSAEFQPP